MYIIVITKAIIGHYNVQNKKPKGLAFAAVTLGTIFQIAICNNYSLAAEAAGSVRARRT